MILSSKSLQRALDLLSRLPGGHPDDNLVELSAQKATRRTADAMAIVKLDGEGEGTGFVWPSDLRRLQLDEKVELTFADKLKLESGRLKGSFPYFKETVIPVLKPKDEAKKVQLSSEQLEPSLACLDNADTKPASTSICLRGGWVFGTLRGHLNLGTRFESKEIDCVIPKDIALAMLGFLPGLVSIYSNVVQVESDTGTFIGKLGEEGYPNFAPCLDLPAKPFATFKSTELRKVIDSLATVDPINRIEVWADEGEVHVSAKGKESDVRQFVPAQTFSKEKFLCNGAKLALILKFCHEDVEMGYENNLIQVKTDKQLFQLKSLIA